MSEAAQRLLEDALRLTPEERSLLAQQLLESLPVANDELEAEDLAALDAAIEESYADEAAGKLVDLFEALPQLGSVFGAGEQSRLARPRNRQSREPLARCGHLACDGERPEA